MKCEIKKEKKKFKPVTLTIETEKEFKLLWNILNKNLDTCLDDYLGCGRHEDNHAMQDLKIEYDFTVRDAAGKIVQFAYVTIHLLLTFYH